MRPEAIKVFLFCFFFVGLPLGIIGPLLADWQFTNELRRTGIDGIAKLAKDHRPFGVNLPSKLRVFFGLCFLKSELLVEQALLKLKLLRKELLLESEVQPGCEPRSEQSSQDGAPDANKQQFVFHEGDATRPSDRIKHDDLSMPIGIVKDKAQILAGCSRKEGDE